MPFTEPCTPPSSSSSSPPARGAPLGPGHVGKGLRRREERASSGCRLRAGTCLCSVLVAQRRRSFHGCSVSPPSPSPFSSPFSTREPSRSSSPSPGSGAGCFRCCAYFEEEVARRGRGGSPAARTALSAPLRTCQLTNCAHPVASSGLPISAAGEQRAVNREEVSAATSSRCATRE